MKIVFVLFLLYVSLFGTSCRTAGVVEGKRYNDMLKRWFKQDLSIYVCNQQDYPYYLNIQGIMESRVAITEDERKSLIKALEKAKKWAKKAYKEKVDSFSKELYRNSHHFENNENTLEIRFFTANNGKQNDLIIDTVDFDNMFKKGNLYIESSEITQFINTLKKSDKVLKDLQKADSVAESFN